MPNPNDLPADSAVSQLTIDLCRELYDRFAMGGWMPQDAHEQTEAMIRQRFDTPAAAAGPRQSQAEKELSDSIRRAGEAFNWDLNAFFAHVKAERAKLATAPTKSCHNCGKPMADTQVRCLFCDAYEPAVPPVPQEAAPDIQDECLVCGKHIPPGPDFCSDVCEKRATAPDSAMRVAEQLGTCRTPHFLGEPTPDRKALTQIPHQELPQGLCRDWQAIDRVAATKEPQSKGQDGSPVFMQTNTAPVYMCPAGCGCLWRDNQDGTMSLYGPNSKSCEKCEYMPLKELTPLIRGAGSERERRLMSVLFVIMSDMPKKRDWLDPDIEREASRLLGGESKP